MSNLHKHKTEFSVPKNSNCHKVQIHNTNNAEVEAFKHKAKEVKKMNISHSSRKLEVKGLSSASAFKKRNVYLNPKRKTVNLTNSEDREQYHAGKDIAPKIDLYIKGPMIAVPSNKRNNGLFYIRKSEKKLTIPAEPNLSTNERASQRENFIKTQSFCGSSISPPKHDRIVNYKILITIEKIIFIDNWKFTTKNITKVPKSVYKPISSNK
jgi:hypothetical protein